MRYAYWVLSDPRRLAQLVGGQAVIPRQFKIEAGRRKVVRNYLRRVVCRQRGERASVKLERTFTLDADMYDLKTSASGTQVLAITSLVARRRIRIPLTGQTVMGGNIQIVLNEQKQRVEVHYRADIKQRQAAAVTEVVNPNHSPKQEDSQETDEVVVAVDAGLSSCLQYTSAGCASVTTINRMFMSGSSYVYFGGIVLAASLIG